MSWPICPLCQIETEYLDEFGICKRISLTHQAIRNPADYTSERYGELWEVIKSGQPVFPLTPRELAAHEARQQRLAA